MTPQPIIWTSVFKAQRVRITRVGTNLELPGWTLRVYNIEPPLCLACRRSAAGRVCGGGDGLIDLDEAQLRLGCAVAFRRRRQSVAGQTCPLFARVTLMALALRRRRRLRPGVHGALNPSFIRWRTGGASGAAASTGTTSTHAFGEIPPRGVAVPLTNGRSASRRRGLL